MSEEPQAPRLLEAVRAGHDEALGELYLRYGPTVYGIALQLTGSTADAWDVTQDVFVGLPEALVTLRDPFRFEPWLRRIVVRAALGRLRSNRQRRTALAPPGELGLTRAVDPPETVDRVELERGIEALPPHLRTVFLLREVEGFSHREIGGLLGITVRASRVRLHRARRWLQKRLGPR